MTVEFSRRDFVRGIGTGAVLTAGGGSFSCQPVKKGARKEAARNRAMNGFTKAMWVYLNRSFPNGENDIPVVLDKWAEAGFSLLIPEIKKGDGRTHYRRTKHQVSEYAKDWDPLEVFNAEAKKRGMKVHPWCHVFRGAGSKFAKKHPEFIGLNKDGKNEGEFLCPAKDAVHNWAYSFYEELMDNYDVAGVHLDYIRYRGSMCWCDYCKRIFKRETGIGMDEMEEGSPEWARWITQRVYNINKFVKRLQDEAIKRDKETSAAVFAEYPKCIVGIGQDWFIWAHNKWVDYVLPMNYWGMDEKFNRNADIHIGGVNASVPVFEGFANRLPHRPFEVNLTPEGLFKRSQYIKDMGFQGVCYFSSSSINDEELDFIKKL